MTSLLRNWVLPTSSEALMIFLNLYDHSTVSHWEQRKTKTKKKHLMDSDVEEEKQQNICFKSSLMDKKVTRGLHRKE